MKLVGSFLTCLLLLGGAQAAKADDVTYMSYKEVQIVRVSYDTYNTGARSWRDQSGDWYYLGTTLKNLSYYAAPVERDGGGFYTDVRVNLPDGRRYTYNTYVAAKTCRMGYGELKHGEGRWSDGDYSRALNHFVYLSGGDRIGDSIASYLCAYGQHRFGYEYEF